MDVVDSVIVNNEEHINNNMVTTTKKEILDYYLTRNNYNDDISTSIKNDNLIHNNNLDLEKASLPRHKILVKEPPPNNINTYRTSNLSTCIPYRISNNMKNINNKVEVDFGIEPIRLSNFQSMTSKFHFPTTIPINTSQSTTIIPVSTSQCSTTISDLINSNRDISNNIIHGNNSNNQINVTTSCTINNPKEGVQDAVGGSCNNNNC